MHTGNCRQVLLQVFDTSPFLIRSIHQRSPSGCKDLHLYEYRPPHPPVVPRGSTRARVHQCWAWFRLIPNLWFLDCKIYLNETKTIASWDQNFAFFFWIFFFFFLEKIWKFRIGKKTLFFPIFFGKKKKKKILFFFFFGGGKKTQRWGEKKKKKKIAELDLASRFALALTAVRSSIIQTSRPHMGFHAPALARKIRAAALIENVLLKSAWRIIHTPFDSYFISSPLNPIKTQDEWSNFWHQDSSGRFDYFSKIEATILGVPTHFHSESVPIWVLSSPLKRSFQSIGLIRFQNSETELFHSNQRSWPRSRLPYHKSMMK